MTFAVDWALKLNYLSIFFNAQSTAKVLSGRCIKGEKMLCLSLIEIDLLYQELTMAEDNPLAQQNIAIFYCSLSVLASIHT